jgi:DNA uptake protein ComE-like DNA-binding protein
MKNYHKINPFWTYSRSERIGITILTIGVLFNAYFKWKNNRLLESKIMSLNKEIIFQKPPVDSTIPIEIKAESKQASTAKKQSQLRHKKRNIKINLAEAKIDDLLGLQIDSTTASAIIKNKHSYTEWRSVCNNNPACSKLLENKKIYYWTDYSKLIISINKADSIQLKQLKGIGSVLSNRIIKYRNRLGGFVYKEQLLEVWGLTAETYDKINPHIKIDSIPTKLSINQSADQFINHPYTPYAIRNQLSNYLEFNMEKVDSINKMDLPYLKDSVKNKLSYYFE